MSQTNVRDRPIEADGPIPYRAVSGLRIKAGGSGAAPVHFIRSGSRRSQLGEEEYFIFSTLDGIATFAEVEKAFRARFAGDLSRAKFQLLMDELLEAGIIEPVDVPAPAGPRTQAARAEGRAPAPATPPPVPARPPPVPAGAAVAGRRPAGVIARAFLFCADVASPLRYFAWLLFPATAAAGALLFASDLRGIKALSVIRNAPLAEVAGALLFVLLLPVLAKGTVAAFHGSPSKAFRLRPTLLDAPIDNAVLALLPRKARVWTHAAPLLASLALFDGGITLWAAQGGSRLGASGLLLAALALLSLLLRAPPLWLGEGRQCLFAFLEIGAGKDTEDAQLAIRRLRASASAISVLAIAAALLLVVTRDGAWWDVSPALATAAYAATLIWLWVARRSVGPLRDPLTGYARTPGVPWPRARPGGGGVSAASARPFSLDERLFAGGSSWPSNRRVIWLAVAVAVAVAVVFLPYPYRSGGTFTILAYDRVTLPARVSGELTEVLVREGEWVGVGRVVATLSDWTEVHSLGVAQADLQQAMANLQNLLISPKPEEVEVARRQYELALSRLPFSKADYERKLTLVKTNDVSVRQFQLALSAYQQDQAAVEITRANYNLVRVGSTEAQLSEARANVQKQQEQVTYWKDQLNRTRIRAPVAGQVVTPNPQLLKGHFLQEGNTFIQLEDHHVAHLEVLVPETDIRDIHVGSEVWAKAWGYEHTMWLGKVVLIAPSAQPSSAIGGNVVRVVAEIPNPDGLLRADMSGYAKIETVQMPVWMSYTRALMRFLLIELWGWIP